MPTRRYIGVGASVTAAALALALGPTFVGNDAGHHPRPVVPAAPKTGTTAGTAPVLQPERPDPTAVSRAEAPAARCTAVRLRTLGGAYGSSTGTAARYVVGVASDASGAQHPVLWRNGVPTRLDTGLVDSVPTSVNATGLVVGTGVDPRRGTPVGWYWQSGKTRLLPALHDRAAVPSAVNGRGVIVGALAEVEAVEHEHGEETTTKDQPFALNERAHDDEAEKAALWTSATAAPRQLAPLTGDDGAHAYAISPAGLAGGVSLGSSFRPVVWDATGRPRALALLGGGWSSVRGFEQDGTPVGEAATADGSLHVVRWRADGSVVDLGRGSVPQYLARLGVLEQAAGYRSDALGAHHPLTWRCSG
jgi:uncharacterized membrane protein